MLNKTAMQALLVLVLVLIPVSIASAQPSTGDFKKAAKLQSELSKQRKTTCNSVSSFADGVNVEFHNWHNDEEVVIVLVFINAYHPSAQDQKKLLQMVGDDDYTLEYSETRVDGAKGRESAGSYLTFKKREPARSVPKKK